MKTFSIFAAVYAVFAFLVFRTADTISQTLAPVASGGFDWWPLVIIVGIAAAAGGFYLWHKRNPAGATAAAASAAQTVQADAVALGHKALDLARGLRDTVDKQAVVIASPPVQAAINGAPFVPQSQPLMGGGNAMPAAQPVASAAIAPQAAPTPVAAPAPYTGPFFDITGKPDPMGQYDARTWRIAAGQAADNATTRANGPVDVKSLSDDEKAYLLYAQENFGLPGAELFFAVLNGSKTDIDAAIAWADTHRGQVPPAQLIAEGNVRLGGYVDAYSKRALKPIYTNSP